LIKCSVIERDSRVGNENMPRSLTIEGKRSLRIRAMNRHHLAEGSIMDTQ
jgi:hypothetical protein